MKRRTRNEGGRWARKPTNAWMQTAEYEELIRKAEEEAARKAQQQ